MIHTVEGFGVVNKAEVDVFLELSCFLEDQMDVGNLISGSSAFSKSSLNICNFSVHILLKPGLENFEHYFASVWDECNCVVFWAFFGIAFLWDWNENWPFPILWLLLSFPNLLAYWVQHFHSIIFQVFTFKRFADLSVENVQKVGRADLWSGPQQTDPNSILHCCYPGAVVVGASLSPHSWAQKTRNAAEP